jgi:hypothetical protein
MPPINVKALFHVKQSFRIPGASFRIDVPANPQGMQELRARIKLSYSARS